MFVCLPAEAQHKPEVTTRRPRLASSVALLQPNREGVTDIDLRLLPTLTLRVRNIAGAPARRARVVLQPLPITKLAISSTTLRTTLDLHGALRVQVQTGKWSLFIYDEFGWHHEIVAVAKDRELSPQLQPFSERRGTILLATQQPAVTATFHVNHISHDVRAKNQQGRALHSLGKMVNKWLAARSAIDANGNFRLRFLDVAGVSYKGIWVCGQSPDIARMKLEAAVEPEVLILQPPSIR